MAFSDHKIQSFTKQLSDLPDQPNLSAAELKAYFDSSPEELRQSVNGLCTDAARLDDRVSGIVAETFGDAIPKSMLSTELQAEIDAKAEETAVAQRLAAADTRIGAVEAALPQKCEVFCGAYEGDNVADRFLPLPFTPQAALIFHSSGMTAYSVNGNLVAYGGFALRDTPCTAFSIAEGGLRLSAPSNICRSNNRQNIYLYLALRAAQ